MDRTRNDFSFEAVATKATAPGTRGDHASPDDADPKCAGPDPRTARITLLSRVLRVIGALVVAASAGTFLFQRWETGTDLTRYFALLAQAGLLSGAGFFCAVRLSESRSARTFQALAAGMVPALFAILGGLVYSQWSLDGPPGEIASYATWVAPSPFAALATLAATLLVTVPVSMLALLSLARSEARVLTTAFVVANAALLVPTRDPAVMAGLVAAGFLGLATLERRRFHESTAMRTREGLLVRAMLTLPFVLVIARSLVHYELSLYMASILSFGIAGLLFAFARIQQGAATAAPFELGGLVPMAVGWLAFAGATVDSFDAHEGVFLPLAALPFAMTVHGLALVVRSENAGRLRALATGIALWAMGGNLLLDVGVLPMFLALVTGIAGIVHGFLFESRRLMVLGAVVGAGALVAHVREAIDLYAHFHWASLSVLGGAVILGASLLERHHAAIGRRLARLRGRARGGEAA